jgi:hypothetical protein
MKKEVQFYVMCFGLAACVFSNGCMRTGPYTVTKDQFDYATAIGDAKKQQILMNIVKLRYAEWPVFLEINQVVAGYNWEQTGTATLSLERIFAGDTDRAQLGYSGRFIERPTITYTPLGGDRFVRSILTPTHPESLLTMIEAGWPADRLVLTMVDSVNGKINRRFMYGTDYPTDPAFIRFVRLLKKIHIASGFTIRTTPSEDQTIVYELCFRPQLLDAETLNELDQVKALLGLNPDTDSYRIVWGSVSEDPNTIAIKTRSIIQVMIAMAMFIELPEEMTRGEVVEYKPTLEEDQQKLLPLLNIHSGPRSPADAFVAVRYQDQSFWINANDLDSKLSLAYLTLMLTLTETSDVNNPQLTISTN